MNQFHSTIGSLAEIFVHGYRVCVKGRTLKRGSSLLKHARFLSNLEVTPALPQPVDKIDDQLHEGSEMQENDDE